MCACGAGELTLSQGSTTASRILMRDAEAWADCLWIGGFSKPTSAATRPTSMLRIWAEVSTEHMGLSARTSRAGWICRNSKTQRQSTKCRNWLCRLSGGQCIARWEASISRERDCFPGRSHEGLVGTNLIKSVQLLAASQKVCGSLIAIRCMIRDATAEHESLDRRSSSVRDESRPHQDQ